MKRNSSDSSVPLARPVLLTISLFALAILALILYPSVHPHSGIRLSNDSEDIKQRSQSILASMQLDSSTFTHDIRVVSNPSFLERVYSRNSVSEANRMLRESGSGYRWSIRSYSQDSTDLQIQLGTSESQQVARMLAGDLTFHFDMHGKLVRLWVPVPDSLALPSLSTNEALAQARALLLMHARIAFLAPFMSASDFPDSSKSVRQHDGITYTYSDLPRRRDHTFSWVTYDAGTQDSVDCSVTVSGNVVSDFQHAYRSLNDNARDASTMAEILEIVFYAVFGVIMLIAGFRRLRAYEIGFRSAIIIGVSGAVIMAIWLLKQVVGQRSMDLEVILSISIVPLFVGLGFLLLWAISESVGRETWKEKFISFDMLFHGQFLHSRVGTALLTGLTAGFALIVLGLLASWLVSLWTPVWILERSGDGIGYLTAPLPGLYLIGEALFSNIAGSAFFFVFLLSILRQRFSKTWLLVIIAVAVLTMIDLPNLVPLPQGYIVLLPVIAGLVLLFLWTDVVTSLTAMVTLSVLNQGLLFVVAGNTAFYSDGFILLVMLVVLIILAFIAMTTPDRVLDPEDFAPVFQRHITERQRLSRELEIARDVQMSFLPKRNPLVPGLDIASHCAPALEVGGDYYDFIDMGPGKLGIAIGDVSGKGTQAAFYMTLTKGFLKALGTMTESPSKVLGELNRLFYDNVDRGHFISMIYAVFDMDKRTLTIARAGHSPVMHRTADTSVNIIQSRGIALGFEGGEKFSATIEEVSLPLNHDDVFVFYTDGYPEAMTRAREEFGEKRLTETLQRFKGENAQSVLDHLYTETQRFTGRAPQHDDMTMVVVHVH